MADKYTIGIDFGTLSGRAVLVRVSDGREMASAVLEYRHAVMDEVLAETGERLPADFALEHPADYLDVLEYVIPKVIADSGVDKHDVIGVGIDFTCCTILPIYKDGTPLCFTDKYRRDKHAYVKLWKHHAAQKYADRMTEMAARMDCEWIRPFGGKLSSEWYYPKLWELCDKAPDIYDECDAVIESGDWIVMQLTGRLTRSYQIAAYKAQYARGRGFPEREFFAALDPRLADCVKDKLWGDVISLGKPAGYVTREAAERFGLAEGTAVSSAMGDAHVAGVSLGVTHEGQMFAVFGTSNCYFLLGREGKLIKGICGCVEDGLGEELYCYESGLCCAGDHYAWFADNLCPAEYRDEAEARGISPLRLLIEKASKQKPGEHGLIALDWWNGNRSVLVDAELGGMFLGMNLRTKAEDMLRALIEATAYATRVIFETMDREGLHVDSLCAAGGVPRKDPFTMQIFADVLGCEIRIAGSSQMPALGSAIYAAAAAGSDAGGYDSIEDASEHMKNLGDRVYRPDPEAHKVYSRLYAEYKLLHDYFGRGENDVMKRLRAIAAEARNS